MKRILLFAMGLMAVASVSAQRVQNVEPLAISKSVSVSQFMNQRQAPAKAAAQAPFKSAAEGVFYARPAGTFWLGSSSAKYLVVPPFTEMRFINVSEDVSSTSWTLGSRELNEYVNEDGDLVYRWDKIDWGYVGYAPVLSNGKADYQIADYILTMDSVEQLVYPYNYTDCPRYYGYSNGESAFESGNDVFDWDGDGTDETFHTKGFLQYFEKPAAPMLLSDVIIWATTPNKRANLKFLEPLKLKFYRVERDEEGYRHLGEQFKEIGLMSAEFEAETVSDNAQVYPGTLIFADVQEDEFGTPIPAPFLIDTEYAIVMDVDGFTKSGEESDIRFYFANQGSYAEEMQTRATPTYIMCTSLEGDSLGNLSYYNPNASTPYCYNLAYMFDIMMDGIEVQDSTENHVAPVAGGSTQTEEFDGTYVWTNWPMFETDEEGNAEWTGNYEFEGLPEWASLKIDPTYYEYKKAGETEDDEVVVRGLHIVWFEVEPLPEGVKGRKASIEVVSVPYNLKAGRAIQLVQGEPDDTSVPTLVYDANGKFVKSYNISGRVVGDTSKGVTIKGGKKYFVK